ncbi:TPA: ead/Ea22-like family protein [Raoultella ornithinolytica]
MTTDITELAQSLKAAITEATPGGWYVDYDFDVCTEGCGFIAETHGNNLVHNAQYIALANPANVKLLVEELEKAQRHANLTEAERQAYLGLISKRDERIAELEDAEQKLCSANVTLDARAEQAERERENWRTSFDNERFRADKLKAHIDDIEPIRAAAEKLVRCKGRYHSELNYRTLAALFGVTTPDLPPLEHENVHYADAAEMEIAALRQRIAELESRTVKLAADRAAESGISGYDGTEFYRAGWNARGKADKEALTAAGINWEAE